MSKPSDIVHSMMDYVHQLKRHTQSRRALHIRLSVLERHMQEPFYRREVASALRPLVTGKGAKLFALSNADCILVTHEATLDDIAPPVADIRKKLRDSETLAQMDPVVGISDQFIEWWDLETDYADFAAYTEQLAEQLLLDFQPKQKKPQRGTKGKATPKLSPPPEETERQLDAFILASVMRKLPNADVSSALREQTVMAVVGSNRPTPVLVHKYIDTFVLTSKLTGIDVTHHDRWLEGCLSEELAIKLLQLKPDLKNKSSMATCIRLTCAAIVSDVFDRFDATFKKAEKNAIVIEFSLVDILAHPRAYAAAYRKIESRGYKISLADVEPESLLWLDYEKLHATFIKLRTPDGVTPDWLSHDLEQDLIARISQIGRARVILAGCETDTDIRLGQQLGITLFQGKYLD